MMDWLTNIPDWLSLLFGGSLISIVTWRFARQKAAAEAKEAEAKAKQAEAEAEKARAVSAPVVEAKTEDRQEAYSHY